MRKFWIRRLGMIWCSCEKNTDNWFESRSGNQTGQIDFFVGLSSFIFAETLSHGPYQPNSFIDSCGSIRSAVKHQFFGKHRTNYLPFYFIVGSFIKLIHLRQRLDGPFKQIINIFWLPGKFENSTVRLPISPLYYNGTSSKCYLNLFVRRVCNYFRD